VAVEDKHNSKEAVFNLRNYFFQIHENRSYSNNSNQKVTNLKIAIHIHDQGVATLYYN
jgi:hypothetical protein